MADIFRLSEAASLGVHAMAYLNAHPDQRPNAAAIAAGLGVSPHHLAKVLQRLTRSGLIDSARGPAGGFRLAKPGGEISLLEVYEAIEGSLAARPCLLGSQPLCAGGKCLLGPLNQELHEKVRRHFAKTTLRQMPWKARSDKK
jgi:Rrf2 family protein